MVSPSDAAGRLGYGTIRFGAQKKNLRSTDPVKGSALIDKRPGGRRGNRRPTGGSTLFQ
jgi:hypothetical protein